MLSNNISKMTFFVSHQIFFHLNICSIGSVNLQAARCGQWDLGLSRRFSNEFNWSCKRSCTHISTWSRYGLFWCRPHSKNYWKNTDISVTEYEHESPYGRHIMPWKQEINKKEKRERDAKLQCHGDQTKLNIVRLLAICSAGIWKWRKKTKRAMWNLKFEELWRGPPLVLMQTNLTPLFHACHNMYLSRWKRCQAYRAKTPNQRR